jgi:hypothetical protein
MLYKINLFDTTLPCVRTGKYLPFSTFTTGSYVTARKTALDYSLDLGPNCCVSVHNMETGNRQYFRDGEQIE